MTAAVTKDWRGTEITVGCTVVYPVGKHCSIREAIVVILDPFTVHATREMSGFSGRTNDSALPANRSSKLLRPDRVTVVGPAA